MNLPGVQTLTSAAASILIHNDGDNILRRGITPKSVFFPGDTCMRAIKI